MRILFITSSNNASGGGRQALYLADGLGERGHEVSFFSPSTSLLRSISPNLDWRDLPERRGNWRILLESSMPKNEPVIVHAFHNKAVKSLAWAGTLWRFFGRPVACVAHRGVIYPPNNILPYVLPGIQVFAVNSRACLDTLPLLWRKNAGKVVYNCVPKSKITPTRSSVEVRTELGINPETLVLGCVGNNAPVKGLEFLIRAFARMRQGGETGYILCLVGGSEKKWSPICAELGILEHVRFIPRTEHVADYLQLFTLFVLPSLSESSPNTLLEAMCMGLPAVCSNVGGVSECVSNERLLVPPGDDSALAQTMIRVLADREALALAAKDNLAFSAQFDVTRKLDIMEDIYTNLVFPHGRLA